MPKFAIISPTHISGKKKYAWENFKKGGYIAFGSVWAESLAEKTNEEIKKIVYSIPRKNSNVTKRRVKEYIDFMSLRIGDYVAVNNTNDGLFGLGRIKSEYYFKRHAYDTGSTDPNDFYSHFYDVEWLITQYLKRKDILLPDEKGWAPYGIIKVLPDLPLYIKRLLKDPLIFNTEESNRTHSVERKEIKAVCPKWLEGLISDVNKLKRDKEHKERAHESLVETFYELLGFSKYTEIKHRQGRIDISITVDNRIVIVNKVKKDWDLSWHNRKALLQAYNYAFEVGALYVVLTNGDYYAIFDKRQGHSYDSQLVGEFRLTKLTNGGLSVIEKIKKENVFVD